MTFQTRSVFLCLERLERLKNSLTFRLDPLPEPSERPERLERLKNVRGKIQKQKSSIDSCLPKMRPLKELLREVCFCEKNSLLFSSRSFTRAASRAERLFCEIPTPESIDSFKRLQRYPFRF
jgi:hypothetical protein